MKIQLDFMFHSGIQAIGDITNTEDTLSVKAESQIESHSFIELFGLQPDEADKIWTSGVDLCERFQEQGLPASLTPHAPYSLSRNLWMKFRQEAARSNETLSIHHMESPEEDILFTQKTGPLADRFRKMGLSQDEFPGPANSSTDWLSHQLPDYRRILLIHNTFSTFEDIQRLENQHPQKQFYFGVCPNANLYIENALPAAIIENRKNIKVCIGTDSLASNHQLSIWEEIITLHRNFPDVHLQEFLKMACKNGAEALGMEKELGSFAIGKRPGLILIEGINLTNLTQFEESRIRRII